MAGELREIIDASTDLIMSLDGQGRLRLLNRTACDALGYTEREVTRLTLREIVAPADLIAIEQTVAEVRASGRAQLVEFDFLTSTQRSLHVKGTLLAPREGPAGTMLGVFHREAEAKPGATTEWHRAQAEQQIIQNVAREQELIELKSQFISMASHELRTPLAALSLGVDFLAKYWTKLSSEQINKNLKTVDATVRQLRSVLDDVLIVSRGEEGQLRCKPALVELVAFGRKVADEAAAADQQRHPIFVRSPDEQCEAEVDPQLLSHILTNLLGNACKYSPPDSPAELTIARTDGHVTLVVSDQGMGIPLEDQPRLFDLFFRASNVGDTPGSGLGLVVVRRCVVAHGGTVTLDSAPGRGTRVTVTLPRQATP